jgi:N-acetylmuramoyl-L-alanine amidase
MKVGAADWRMSFASNNLCGEGSDFGADFARANAPIFFLNGFARVSPFFAAALLGAAGLIFSPGSQASYSPSSSASTADPTAAAKRQAASSQFAHAEEQRAALNSKSPEKRTLADYKQVVGTYRRLYLIAPKAAEVPDALAAVAELYGEMGEKFGRSYYQSAVDTYQFLMREYPTSKYCQDAYLKSAALQKDQLGDVGGAIKTYEAFLKKYPHSPHKREAQEARAELALLQNSVPASDVARSVIARTAEPDSEANDAAPKKPGKEVSREPAPEIAVENSAKPTNSGRIPQVRMISMKNAKDSARVTIDLESGVQYVSGRIANPDRIYFDLHGAKLTPQLAHGKIKADGTLLTAIRVAQSSAGVVRVVLDVNGVKDYTASLLNSSQKGGPTRLVIDLFANAKAIQAAKVDPTTMGPSPKGSGTPVSAESLADEAQSAANTSTKTAKTDASETAPTIPQPKNKLATAKVSKGSGKTADLAQPAAAPQPTRDGQSTLTRALGLKIGRIVLDAGHGGHDTGTIGPTGLMEKDLCLDVALRLGKIIQQRLPSAEVVFTRSDDTFIPLEERTHIANDAKADMFISIHANSSHDSLARGIETYYLNLKGSDEAMEVAARENATSDQGIHELQDLVKQIARTEKIDESKEFAEDVQDSLAKRMQKAAKPVKNRGVRKAPFVVLIGADMPSILTEISFLSNPADEKMLKQPEHRQRVAEGIYQGVASYLQSLNSMSVNQSAGPAPKRTSTSAASTLESSRNRN